MQSVKNQDSKSGEKVRQIRDEYEKKISRLQGELKKMQAAKKEHAQLLRQKAQNEQQLRTFQAELKEMKKTKVRLMKQMKEEAAKSKQQEAQRNKEIAQLKKESRLRQMTIKNLETERRQREVVLKRKKEEVFPSLCHFYRGRACYKTDSFLFVQFPDCCKICNTIHKIVRAPCKPSSHHFSLLPWCPSKSCLILNILPI